MHKKIKLGLFVFIIIGVVILNFTYKNKNEETIKIDVESILSREKKYADTYDKNKEEIIKEHFANKDEVLEIIEKYHPVIVSNEEINNEEIKSSKQKLDVSKIISYYQNEQEDNYFTIKPNYLKLPQALEDRHD